MVQFLTKKKNGNSFKINKLIFVKEEKTKSRFEDSGFVVQCHELFPGIQSVAASTEK